MTAHRVRWPPSRWSLRARVTGVAIAVVGCLLIVGVIAFYQAIRRTVYEQLNDRGQQAVAELVDLEESSNPRGAGALHDEVQGFSMLQIVDDTGRVLASSRSLAHSAAITTERPDGDGGLAVTVSVPGVANDIYVVGRRVHDKDGWRTVYAGSPMTEFKQAKGFFLGTLVLGIALILALLGWAVWRAVRRALRPVRVMSAELTAITGGEGERRVTVPDSGDEVAELAESVNVTLRRLEGVVERHRAFVADASHELRSPLTGLRAQLEVALEHPRDEDWPTVARAALADADRLQRIVTDLLMLAKLDAGVQVEREPVDLGELARDEGRRRTRRVPVHVDAEEGVMVVGARAHLIRLLTNLLDNAERHAETGVWITVGRSGGEAVLEVADDGSGIPAEDRELVFKRFHRLAESRKRDTGGSGLGLPISRDIAAAHGGSLVAEPSERGACLVLRLPLLP
ncbi:HAMP domain-containing histidine kinase [Actinomadura barringtoniae]|uniref:histidine kinase n=1 Tax=Actinomadura barringtoniae TaxID=1427535 RepID=A0A939P620_9ACTN|nr:HAMP domain-containing sensor histidine kinase [Actinomadura barringtoniae]MBO2445740.1 HAMP domain-containing histidine kinase [Actinomadura barringtoniae]